VTGAGAPRGRSSTPGRWVANEAADRSANGDGLLSEGRATVRLRISLYAPTPVEARNDAHAGHAKPGVEKRVAGCRAASGGRVSDACREWIAEGERDWLRRRVHDPAS
jgi:hypothetical protein